MSTLALAGVATLALCGAFAALYFVARRLENYGVVDIAWSYAFGALALFYALVGRGWPPRRLLVAALVGLWALRLGTHLLVRVAKHHPTEDARYTQLRRDWAANFGAKMFGFFQLQALSVVGLGAAFLVAAQNPAARFHPLEIAGAILWVVAILGESLADAQLAAFKRDAPHRGQVCDRGLWRYSRHPNYFFEWLVWVAYALLALASPHGWLGLIGPAGILYLLLRVTGIPLTEDQSLRSKGDAYRRYQATTSAFVPLPPRRQPLPHSPVLPVTPPEKDLSQKVTH
jgi:steroid 5-alpha reductase family enzyme